MIRDESFRLAGDVAGAGQDPASVRAVLATQGGVAVPLVG